MDKIVNAGRKLEALWAWNVRVDEVMKCPEKKLRAFRYFGVQIGIFVYITVTSVCHGERDNQLSLLAFIILSCLIRKEHCLPEQK